jgi:Zn-dependent protease with chaperone function
MVFLAVYFGLAGWFGWVAYGGIRELIASPENWVVSAGKAFLGGFFCALMVKGIFFVRRSLRPDLVEITEKEEPALFHFVRQVAKDAGAPKPHRVFLSARVNAAVFYDVSLLNLIWPSKKNLEVGIGLVNTLSIDEFKAVVAHEFGHFAQRTMTVGTWVYIAHSVVGAMVARRDIFDRMLEGLSRLDIRVAWIGWGMRLVVWSLRAVFDTAFRGIILLERALSRQMEFQADLVSVTVSGSDSLVHALHRLGAADDAWDRAMGFCAAETHNERRPADLFAIQTRVLERMAVILDDPEHGRTPGQAHGKPEQRLFSSALADVPRMWSSHPPNHEREESAKRRYFPSSLDPRSAWLLFRDPAALRRSLTAHALSQMSEDKKLPPMVPIEDSLAKLDEGFNRPRLHSRFRGAFLRDPIARHAIDAGELCGPLPGDPAAAIAAAYPASLSDDLERVKELGDEKAMLEGLKDGFLVAPGGVIRFRGREIRRSELAKVIEVVGAELDTVRKRVEAHDRAARAAHRAAARQLGRGWESHLAGLTALVHYAEHTEADLSDARGFVRHVVEIVTADEKVSDSEMRRLVTAATDVSTALRLAVANRDDVRLPAPLLARFEVEAWEQMFPAFDLYDPQPQDFSQGWLTDMEHQIDVATSQLDRLRNAALDALVEAEAAVERGLRGEDIGDAPQPGRVPDRYTRLRVGHERPRQKRLDLWDRFITADGFVAGTARLLVAGAILSPLAAFAFFTGGAGGFGGREVVIHNGLGIPVHVAIADEEIDVPARGEGRLEAPRGNVHVRATTADGVEIEDFYADNPEYGKAIYNVAGASLLVQFTMTYGTAREVAPEILGAERWVEHSAEHQFEDPPSSLSVRAGSGATRRTVKAVDEFPPMTQVSAIQAPEKAYALARAHARFDPKGPGLVRWFEVLQGDPEAEGILAQRIAEVGLDVGLARVQMDRAAPAEKVKLCAAHSERAKASPDDPDSSYLAVRCQPDGKAQDDAFLAGLERFPSHSFFQVAVAWVWLGRGEWSKGLRQLEALLRSPDARETLGSMQLAGVAARVRRLLSDRPHYEDLTKLDGNLEQELSIESEAGRDESALTRAFRHLRKGELPEALRVRDLAPPVRARLELLVGASDGATPAQIDAALRLPGEGELAWYVGPVAFALAQREGKSVTEVRARLGSYLAEEPEAFAALDPTALAKNPAKLDQVVVGMDPRFRGAFRAAGIVLLGKKAPALWRKEATALLFASERPYFAD